MLSVHCTNKTSQETENVRTICKEISEIESLLARLALITITASIVLYKHCFQILDPLPISEFLIHYPREDDHPNNQPSLSS